jgi:hypothetical protein
MPAFALFFPISLAIAATAIVHLANNIFKLFLVGRFADRKLVLLFGIPAAFCAAGGAWLLSYVSTLGVLVEYEFSGRHCEITVIGLIVGLLIGTFSLFELFPRLRDFRIKPKYMPVGGALSGFFGGLSGHQGTWRAAFLIRAGLDKKAYIATAVVCSVVVDVTRLTVYGYSFFTRHFELISDRANQWLVIVGVLAAFAGSFGAARFMEKVTMKQVRLLVGIFLFAMAIGITAGII